MVNTLVYYSTSTKNTERFMMRMKERGYEAIAIPRKASQEMPILDKPYILVVPTYKGGSSIVDSDMNTIPKQVTKFLNHENNASHMTGVVASGNVNFAEDYCLAGHQIEQRYLVPFLMKFEMSGTEVDAIALDRIIKAVDRFVAVKKYKKNNNK